MSLSIPDSARELLDSPTLAHLSTVSKDGSPHVVVAWVQEGGAPELLQKLAETYVGPGVKFPPMDDPPAGYVTRISVDRIAGIGPWAT